MDDINEILLAIVFWKAMALVVYTYVVYPLLVSALARRPKQRLEEDPLPTAASIVIAARNEEANIGRRVNELAGMIQASGIDGEIIVVSDGSTDRTVERAEAAAQPNVHVVELTKNVGKAAALNIGCAAATKPFVVFADARQTWDPQALSNLLENFRDKTIGAVSGNLVLESAAGAVGGVGLYWRYEKWLRGQESRLGSITGVSGSISAVRRELYQPIPPGTILDDVYWPLRVAMQRYRIVLDERAKAFDRLPPRSVDEFRRKVRTLTGNFQLFTRLPASLLPWSNPIWFQFVSHKLCRLIVPWALIALLLTSALIDNTFYSLAFWAQVCCYLIALIGIITGSRLRLVSAASGFLMLNSAAWLSFWVWISGRSEKAWRKTTYANVADAMEV